METGGIRYDFQFNQDRPDQLMRVPKPPDIEIRTDNEFYGQAAVLKEYAGLPRTYPLRLVLDHGLIFDGRPGPRAKVTDVKTVLVPSRLRARILRTATENRVVPIGFGFLYAKALQEARGLMPLEDSRRAGTLVYPYKTRSRYVVGFDHRAFARQLLNLPDELQPVVVCLYYLDYLNGANQAYEAEGVPVVSAGQRHDPDFLPRQYDLCRHFRYAASNFLGTNMFIAVESGCRFFFLDGPELDVRKKNPEDTTQNVEEGPVFDATYARARQLFPKPVEAITPEQRKFIVSYFGNDCMRSPGQLRSVLLNAHRRQEGRKWWYPARRLLAPPDGADYRFTELAPGDGWYRIEKSGDRRYRWMGYTREAWLELGWKKRKGNQAKEGAVLACEIAAVASQEIVEGLEISVNGEWLAPLRRGVSNGNLEIRADVPASLLAKAPEPGRARIGFRVPQVLRHCDVFPLSPLERTLGVAVCRISLFSRHETGGE